MKKGFFLAALMFSAQVFSHSIGNKFEEFEAFRTIHATLNYHAYHIQMLDLYSRDIDIAGVDLKEKKIDLILTPYEYQELKSEGYEISLNSEILSPMAPDADYKSPQEIEDFLKAVADRYPEITQLKSIGKSLEGRDIWAIKISDNAKTDELEPVIFYNSMHHAREIMTPEVGWDIVETLTEGYGSDDKITAWVDRNEIWVIPMFNVDGNNKVWGGSSMWRKNTRGGYGVDINRNYPEGWNSCNGSSGSRWSQTYRGPRAASEPETQAMMNFVSEIKPVFSISYHSYSELVLYPYGCQGQKTETHEIIAKIGKKMGEVLDYTAGTPWEILYGVDGGDIDWFYKVEQVIPFVIEVSSRSEGFQPRYSQWRDKTVERNKAGWQLLLDRIEGPGFRGVLKAANGDIVTSYTVKVEKVTKDGKKFVQTYRGNPDGSFHIVLNPGEYALTFKSGRGGEISVTQSLLERRVELNPVLE